MTRILLNARFLMRAPTGVDRVAVEFARLLLEDPRFELRALRPPGQIAQADWPKALLDVAEICGSSSGHLWEQHVLARHAPGDMLVSLCNTGPVLRRRQVVMFHDAQVFSQPQAYGRSFRTWYRLMQPRLGRRAAGVLTVSHHARRELEQFGVVPTDKARVLHNGADHILRIPPEPDVLVRHGLEPQGYFLTIGSLAPHKNLGMLAKALPSGGLPLAIAGGGNAAVFAGAGLPETSDLRVLGRVSEGALRALYENAAALVFPSLTEGFGLPPVEAMTCGCPVIASTGGAVPEVCGDAALLCDPRAPGAWRAAMVRVTAEPEVRGDLIAKGRARAAQFTWAAAARDLGDYLIDLAG